MTDLDSTISTSSSRHHSDSAVSRKNGDMDKGDSNSVFYHGIYCVSFLRLLFVKKNSQSVITKAIVEVARQCILYISTTMVYKHIVMDRCFGFPITLATFNTQHMFNDIMDQPSLVTENFWATVFHQNKIYLNKLVIVQLLFTT